MPPDTPLPRADAELPALARGDALRRGAPARGVEAEAVAAETPVAFVYNGVSHAVMMATPRDLTDFAYGFSVAEGVVAHAGEVLAVSACARPPGISLAIAIPPARAAALASRTRSIAGRAGCGLCGIAEIEQALRPLPRLPAGPRIAADAIDRAVAALPAEQALNRATGAVHAAAFAAPDGRLLLVREDVGRHNALDKLIGASSRAGHDPAAGFLVLTSRCSMELVQKAASFGCPVLATMSAPTALALDLAQGCGMTLAAFARGTGFDLYTCPERIA
ncbi:MAG: formate dehydrogenase accessory sulfurtransferase FdhD [Alphaproteobacteria bacterium]|nr:formate dehydrogenase accessory sulfurtransferase FdhD [Alphaproteobacteria bacterium]